MLRELPDRLVDAAALAALPERRARGQRWPVVDIDLLTAEVLSGGLQSALDVVDPEPLLADHALWSSPNALITPHIGGNASAWAPAPADPGLHRQVSNSSATPCRSSTG